MVVVRCSILCFKFIKNRWLPSDPLGELTALQRPPSWIIGEGGERGDGSAGGEGKG